MMLGPSFVEKRHQQRRTYNGDQYLRHHNLASIIMSPMLLMTFLDEKGSKHRCDVRIG